MNDTDGTNLHKAYQLAIAAAGARGMLKLGVFEHRPVLIWTPLDAFVTP